MENAIINKVLLAMSVSLDAQNLKLLKTVMESAMSGVSIIANEHTNNSDKDSDIINKFLVAKRVEGCSEKTIAYYSSTLKSIFINIGKNVSDVSTEDLRNFLDNYQSKQGVSKVTVDNIRRILSTFFSWMEEESYIIKSPVRRIHKVKTGKVVKETYTDEDLERLRDSCKEIRDLAIIDLLSSTGIRVGELVKLDRTDIDFGKRECVVLGKGNKQRIAYFDARTKLHLIQYLNSRNDNNDALFVTLDSPHSRLEISGVEIRLHNMGVRLNIHKVHPHKFRRTLATMAIDKGMPIEQVQRLLGHQSLDTTMQYAMVNQTNVKISHQKFIG